MDGCNAAKLWEQHKFYENIINEPHSYIFSHDTYIRNNTCMWIYGKFVPISSICFGVYLMWY